MDKIQRNKRYGTPQYQMAIINSKFVLVLSNNETFPSVNVLLNVFIGTATGAGGNSFAQEYSAHLLISFIQFYCETEW